MSDPYTLPDAPAIPGLRFRPLAGPSDADGLFEIHRLRAERDDVDPLSSVERPVTREGLVASLAALTAAGAERTIVAEINGRAVGTNGFFDWPESDGTHVWLVTGWVIPEWRGRGLGTAMLRWSEGRIRAPAEATGGRWEFAANASSTEPEATALLLDNGYTAAYTVLEMGLDWAEFAPAAAPPPGIVIRPGRVADAAPIARSVIEAYQDEYEGGRYAMDTDAEAEAADLGGEGHDPTLWRVAWDGEAVAGQVLPVIEGGRAEIFEVSVRPRWRRAGLGRALMSSALLELRERRVEVVRLHTLAEFKTRAVDLYESLGFRTLKAFPRYRKPS